MGGSDKLRTGFSSHCLRCNRIAEVRFSDKERAFLWADHTWSDGTRCSASSTPWSESPPPPARRWV
jgi:hypothetical protein